MGGHRGNATIHRVLATLRSCCRQSGSRLETAFWEVFRLGFRPKDRQLFHYFLRSSLPQVLSGYAVIQELGRPMATKALQINRMPRPTAPIRASWLVFGVAGRLRTWWVWVMLKEGADRERGPGIWNLVEVHF